MPWNCCQLWSSSPTPRCCGIFNFKLLTVYNMTNSSIYNKVTRWAVDGNISYLNDQRHLVLFLIAVFFVMLLLPFSFTLLCIKHIYYLSNCGFSHQFISFMLLCQHSSFPRAAWRDFSLVNYWSRDNSGGLLIGGESSPIFATLLTICHLTSKVHS